jgi:hypothetical protein
MQDNPSTNSALVMVVDRMQAGAHPWWLSHDAVVSMKKWLRPSFDDQLSKPDTWENAGQKVLRLGALIGAVSALIAQWRKPKSEPGAINEKYTMLAAYIVQVTCPERGKWCPGINAQAVDGGFLLREWKKLFCGDDTRGK